jgi:PAS domain S-box-containing protein
VALSNEPTLAEEPPGSPFLDFPDWRAAADALPSMVFTARPDGSLEFVNRRWSEFTGYTPSAPRDEAWRSIVHPDDLERLTVAWRRSVRTGEELSVELRVRKADGSDNWTLSCAAALRNPGGEVVRWYGTVMDIDARKRIEEALREREAMLVDSERRFRALAEAIPVICWTADQSGWIDWYNRRWYEFTGQRPEEAAGWGWQAAHHPDDFLEVMRKWPHSISTGEPFEMEFRLRRTDGAFHWFLTRAEPLRDADGKIVRWYGSNVDVDSQRRSLERTKRVAETLQDVFLPKHLPQRPNLRLDAVYLPAEKDALVGGDWFDAFELPDGRLVFSIGDVAGHGLQASITVGRLRQAIFALAFDFDDPATILKKTDRILMHQEPDTIVTALVGYVDASHTRMTYASAGHPPPMIALRNDVPARILPYGDPPLGIGFEAELRTHHVTIEPDAVVALYTDGIIEFSNDVVAAENKLRTAVALLVGNTRIARPAVAIQEIVLDDLQTRDDAALLVMQFSSVDLATLRADPAALEKSWRFHSSDAYTAHASRQEIMTYLRGLAADPDAVFTAELVLGEILANTVEHAPGLVEVSVDWTGEKPILTVRDTGPGLRSLEGKLPCDVMNEGGRGIYLIRALSDDASMRPSLGYGTELRVVLPIRRRKGVSSPPVI